jgi:hypothetical protein
MKWPKEIVEIRVLMRDGWSTVTRATVRRMPTTVSLSIEYVEDGRRCVSYTQWQPPRHRDENPIRYYRRTGCVDDRFHVRHKGWYYCNPAHCSRRFRSKVARDTHLEGAYAALD